MLDLAFAYMDELSIIIKKIKNNNKYKYALINQYRDNFILPKDIDNIIHHSFVSFFNNEVIGYVQFESNEAYDIINQFSIISFLDKNEPNLIFMNDLYKLIRNLFLIKNVKEINFNISKENLNWLSQIERTMMNSKKIKFIKKFERGNYVFYQIINVL